MIRAINLGFPRVGVKRELKFAQENYWKGAGTREALLAAAKELRLKGLEAFSKTLTNWMDKIANYFVSRSSNGRTEGFNHGRRSTLWRAFGMTNFHHFRLRVLDRFGRTANH